MKTKLFLLVSLLIISMLTQAQKSSAIIRGGLNFANVSVTDNGNIDDAKMLTSFQVGILADIHVGSILYFQPGLLFTGKGTKTQSGTEGSANWYKATTNPYYLELPATLILKSPGDVKFFGGAGPYLAMGVAGKNKIEGAFFGTGFKSEKSIDWSNDDPTTLNSEEGAGFGIMRRFDYGINGTIGVEGKSAVFSVNYGFGLAKLQSASNSSEDNSNKHRVLSFTVGFKL
jgi:outer membrane protein with beta-barrel domain